MTCAAPYLHTWEHKPEYSGGKVSRDRCSRCGVWSCRIWTRGARGVRRIYANRYTPDPRWRDEDATTALPTQRPDTEDPEAA